MVTSDGVAEGEEGSLVSRKVPRGHVKVSSDVFMSV